MYPESSMYTFTFTVYSLHLSVSSTYNSFVLMSKNMVFIVRWKLFE